jgi:integrase/recombinase XerD
METNVIRLSGSTAPKSQPSKSRSTRPEIKFFTEPQIRAIRRAASDAAIVDSEKGNLTGVREWMVIDLLTSSGVRVSECADLRVGDVGGHGSSTIFIRNGKGSKSRTVMIPESLKKHLRAFIGWKMDHKEPVGPDDALLLGQRGPMTAQAIQQIVKGYLKRLGFYEKGKAVHALRHSYAVAVYRREHDLRAVQKQLGHASIQTTTIYADTLQDDVARQVKGLWGTC